MLSQFNDFATSSSYVKNNSLLVFLLMFRMRVYILGIEVKMQYENLSDLLCINTSCKYINLISRNLGYSLNFRIGN